MEFLLFPHHPSLVLLSSHTMAPVTPQMELTARFRGAWANDSYADGRAVYSDLLNGNQLAEPKIRTITGTNSGSMTNAYSKRPVSTRVAICRSDKTPDGSIAAKVPAKMIAAEIMTDPIFFIDSIIAVLISVPRYSLKRSIKKIE